MGRKTPNPWMSKTVGMREVKSVNMWVKIFGYVHVG